jgi:hypothetical protein
MANLIPVIATPVRALPEFISDGENGIVSTSAPMRWANGYTTKPIAVQLHLPLSIETRSNASRRVRSTVLLNSLRSLKNIRRCAVARAPLPLKFSPRMTPLDIGMSSTSKRFAGLFPPPGAFGSGDQVRQLIFWSVACCRWHRQSVYPYRE